MRRTSFIIVALALLGSIGLGMLVGSLAGGGATSEDNSTALPSTVPTPGGGALDTTVTQESGENRAASVGTPDVTGTTDNPLVPTVVISQPLPSPPIFP